MVDLCPSEPGPEASPAGSRANMGSVLCRASPTGLQVAGPRARFWETGRDGEWRGSQVSPDAHGQVEAGDSELEAGVFCEFSALE